MDQADPGKRASLAKRDNFELQLHGPPASPVNRGEINSLIRINLLVLHIYKKIIYTVLDNKRKKYRPSEITFTG